MPKYICTSCMNSFVAPKIKKCEFCKSTAFVDTYGRHQRFVREAKGGKDALKLMAKQDKRLRRKLKL